MIYLDNGATTQVDPKVKDEVLNYLNSSFGNPSSLHKLGVEGEKLIKKAKENLASYLKVGPNSIVFTSGGTEANNHVIKMVASQFSKRGKHIITTKVEHASVYMPMEYLKKIGYDVEYIDVDHFGAINLEELKNKIRKDTILVSIMHVNNELGTVNDINKIAEIIKTINPKAYFHSDVVASFGKLPIDLDQNIDFVSVSAHKTYAPKGIGALYIREGIKLEPLIHGGGQESERRSGTENTLGIIGFDKSIDILKSYDYKKYLKKIDDLRDYTIKEISSKIKDYKINGLEEINLNRLNSSPYVLNISFKGLKGEVLLHTLENSKIYLSTASACNSRSGKKSARVLENIGVDKEFIDGSLRITFNHNNNKEEIDVLIKALVEAVTMLRMFNR